MTLIHHADHLADIPNKRVLRYEVPFAGEQGTEWRFVEVFDTSEPVVDELPDDYINRIVGAFVGRGNGRQGAIGRARPAFQFDADRKPLPAIRDVLAILPDAMTPWAVAFWFVSSNSWLGGPGPRDRLEDVAAIIAAAQHENREIGSGPPGLREHLIRFRFFATSFRFLLA